MKGAAIGDDNEVTNFEVFPWSDLYRGHPSISIGSKNGMLVYEEINDKYGMRISGKLLNIKVLL